MVFNKIPYPAVIEFFDFNFLNFIRFRSTTLRKYPHAAPLGRQIVLQMGGVGRNGKMIGFCESGLYVSGLGRIRGIFRAKSPQFRLILAKGVDRDRGRSQRNPGL